MSDMWGVWCVEEATWCDGTIRGSKELVEVELLWINRYDDVKSGRLHYEMRQLPPSPVHQDGVTYKDVVK